MDCDFYKQVLNSIQDGVYHVDRNRVITFWNKGAERITGFTAREVVGNSCADNILRHVTAEGVELCVQGCPLADTMVDGKIREADVYLHHKKGHRIPIRVRSAALRDEAGKIVGAVETFFPSLTKLRTNEELKRLQREVFIDPVTGIGNRKLAEATLRQRMSDLKEYQVPFGVLFVDIDHFKAVNDTWGHEVGDEVLRVVSNSLAAGLRNMDEVCRWGGEEFLIILPGVTLDHMNSVAERLRILVMNSWLDKDGQRVQATISVGGLLAHDPKMSLETVVKLADEQMYLCKKQGRNRCLMAASEA